tara:strand:- start:314 stop:1690 length:1377 start_codon:yes stop_codon:yes gene_type:complete
MSEKTFDILVIGSGLSSLTFAEEYLKKKSKLHVISPTFKNKYSNISKFKLDQKTLPPQLKKNFNHIEDYFSYNKFSFDKNNCNLLGSLESGGLSNYWGLQMDKDIGNDLDVFGKHTKQQIINNFLEILNEKSLSGSFKNYINDFKIDAYYEKFLSKKNRKNKNFIFEKSLLALNNFNKKKIEKLKPNLIYNKIKNKIVVHNYFLEKIERKKNILKLYCVNKNKSKYFFTKKLILGGGTLSTTRLIMDYLNISDEVPIKHHPRLMSVYLGRNSISSNLDMTPGLFQIKNKNEIFSGDIRPSNEMIIDMALKIYSIFKPFKSILMLLKNYIFFSNNLLSSKYSNLFIKKDKNKFKIYSKKKATLKILEEKQKVIFSYLKKKKIIFPFYKNFFSGIGGDYHYFGTIPLGNTKLSVNKNCQLNKDKSIFIVDGSVLNFKKNLYPLGFVMANAKRIAKIIVKK